MAETAIKYFGTSTTSAGHFFWDVWDEGVFNSRMYIADLPFHPEDLVKSETPFGNVQYMYIENYTVIAISGSCIDKRGGSKSVFFVNRMIDFKVLKRWILTIESTKKIIEKMPFEVRF